MSSDGHSSADSSSDEEDIQTTGLIATRAKRANAGNLLQTLLANIDDEEVQELLVSEGEEEADYNSDAGSGRGGADDDDDDDDAMDSSSGDDDADEADAGPPKEGEKEELDGEKELKKAERAAAKKKRKMDQARMKLPAWQNRGANKRVRLADDAKNGDGVEGAGDAAPPRPKKKSERASWVLDAAPVRQSHRAAAITSREITNANLAQSAARAEKQRTTMRDAAERAKASRRVDLSQEERLAKVVKIEKETQKEFGRWERAEAERQRIREEQLAAKRQRGIEVGPTITHWSGSVLWEGDKIKIPRIKPKSLIEEVEEEEEEQPETKEDGVDVVEAVVKPIADAEPKAEGKIEAEQEKVPAETKLESGEPSIAGTTAPASPSQQLIGEQEKQSAEHDAMLLDGIEAYANEKAPEPAPVQQTSDQTAAEAIKPEEPETVTVDAARGSKTEPVTAETNTAESIQTPPVPPTTVPDENTTTFIAFDPATLTGDAKQAVPLQPTPVIVPTAPVITPAAPVLPPAPLLREQAQRTLILLTHFSDLESTPGPTRRTSKKDASKLNPLLDPILHATPLLSTLALSTHPTFTTDEARYLTTKMKKLRHETHLPAAPTRPRCALTAWPAKYRDPKTGLPYADLQTYKMIQRLLAGGCAWSGFLGAWVGPWYGETGRPARGVPAGFGD